MRLLRDSTHHICRVYAWMLVADQFGNPQGDDGADFSNVSSCWAPAALPPPLITSWMEEDIYFTLQLSKAVAVKLPG
jgi:hypothetical protein